MTASRTTAGPDWVRDLSAGSPNRADALARLHAMLVRIAMVEAARRARALELVGPEVVDIAEQAADDALVAIVRKLRQFRGESQFTTWAAKFVIFEVAGTINRHHWRRGDRALDSEEWSRLPGRLGMAPEQHAEWRELMAALRRAVEENLTPRQRRAFVAIALNDVPIDVLAAESGSNRNAVYKLMFDARRKIRAALVADGLVRDGGIS